MYMPSKICKTKDLIPRLTHEIKILRQRDISHKKKQKSNNATDITI